MSVDIRVGHALDVLRTLPSASVQSICCSPPYFALRAYNTPPQEWGGDPACQHIWGDLIPGDARGGSGTPNGRNGRGEDYGRANPKGQWCQPCGAWRGELGREPTPALFIAHLVDIFREARRVLKPDGCLMVNIGDSYAGSGKGQNADGSANPGGFQAKNRGTVTGGVGFHDAYHGERDNRSRPRWPTYAKPKDLLMIPARLAIALCDDGWYLRAEICWSKPSCMPESVTDRVTRSHEMVYHLAKSSRYFWNAEAISEPSLYAGAEITLGPKSLSRRSADGLGVKAGGNALAASVTVTDTRNRRSVWTVGRAGSPAAEHYATMPVALAELMVLATTRPGDTVLDPFLGAGTTAIAAQRHGRACIGIELQPAYAAMAERRIRGDAPLFADVEVAA